MSRRTSLRRSTVGRWIWLRGGRRSEGVLRYDTESSVAGVSSAVCGSQSQAESALANVQQWVHEAGLTLHPEKTHIVDSRQASFSFLGYSFRGRFRIPRAKSHQKVVDRIRELTPRSSGDSLTQIITILNRSLRGWFNYFRHCFGGYLRYV